MALKNLFDMVKADRYTQDGREALIKEQEAEVEDRVYNIGEISQKTGLQKTANGWVKPKSGKQSGEKTEKEDVKPAGSKSTAITEWEESAKKDAKAYNENMVILQNEKGETTAVRESSPDVEKAEAHGYKKMSLVRPDGSVKKHEGNAESKPAKTANGWVKPKNGKQPGAKKEVSGTTKMTPEQKSKWEARAANSSETTASLRNFISSMSKPEAKANPHADEIVEIYKKELAKRESDPNYRPEKLYDSAPRVLTGDTRIRVRKA